MFTLQFNIDQINVILRGLDMRPHGEVRQVLDYIINEVNTQQRAAQQAQQIEQVEQTDEEVPKH